MRRCGIAVALVFTAVACSQPLAPDTPGTMLPIVRLRSEPYAFSYFSSIAESHQLVLRDAASLAPWWAEAWRMMSHPPAVPDIDFSREMIVVAALGTRPTSGYDILIDSAIVDHDRVTVMIRRISPGAGAVLPVLTRPVDIARLPRRSGSVSFRFVDETR